MSTYDSNIPGSAQYGQAALVAKTAYQQALARINKQRGDVLRQYGFAGDVNPETGMVGNVRVDQQNQYGALQMANRSQAQRDESAKWSGIDRGLGSGGGLAAQLRDRVRFDFGREDAEIGQGLTSALYGLQDEQNQAGTARDRALYEAELEAARFAIENEDFNPADYTGLEVDSPYPFLAPGGGVRLSPPQQAFEGGRRHTPPGFNPVTGTTKKKLLPTKRAAAPKAPTGYAPGGVTYRAPTTAQSKKKNTRRGGI